MLVRPALLLGALLSATGCENLDGGDRGDVLADCSALCALQSEGPGCAFDVAACGAVCIAHSNALGEDCLVKARAYYDCGALLAWSCPAAPDRPESADDRCDVERHALLLCEVTGQ